MAVILNIDTSSKFCSVALASDGETFFGLVSAKEMDHSTSLAPFVEKAMESLRHKDLNLDAVSVIIGPGSYTGLRIGLSLAKGLAYSLSIPLITLGSLQVMAVEAIFSYPDFQGDEIIIPMMDAGRMEVYAAVFEAALRPLKNNEPVILDENSFLEFSLGNKVIFAGDRVKKFKDNYGDKWPRAVWLENVRPHAKFMAPLSEKFFRAQNFADIAYSKPEYLKEYKATISKNKL